jgi:hypothetical protein
MYPRPDILDFPRKLSLSSALTGLSACFLFVLICVTSFTISGQQLAKGQRDILPNASAFGSRTSLYVNSIEGFSVRYPADWEKVEFAPGISEGPRNTIVNFVSPSRGLSDLFREYLIIERVNLTSNHQSADNFAAGEIQYLKQSFPGFNLIQSMPSTNATSYPAHEIEYAYADPIAGNDKAFEVWIVMDAKAYALSYHASAKDFSGYLPTVRMMIDSFTITK